MQNFLLKTLRSFILITILGGICGVLLHYLYPLFLNSSARSKSFAFDILHGIIVITSIYWILTSFIIKNNAANKLKFALLTAILFPLGVGWPYYNFNLNAIAYCILSFGPATFFIPYLDDFLANQLGIKSNDDLTTEAS